MSAARQQGNWSRLLRPMRRLFITALAGASTLAVNDLPQGRAEIRMPQVELLEATVPELQAVLTAGTVTSRDLVSMYLAHRRLRPARSGAERDQRHQRRSARPTHETSNGGLVRRAARSTASR